MVAVKDLWSMLHFNEKQFRNEVDNLMRVTHRNIIRFVGYCYETQQKYISYNGKKEFAEESKRLLCFELAYGSLDKHISGTTTQHEF